jgi:ribonuclease I
VPFYVPQNLEAQMKAHWRSYAKSDTGFWKHEWTKHGTCYSETSTPESFFSTVLKLHSEYDPLAVMKKYGWNPGNEMINATAFADAFPN